MKINADGAHVPNVSGQPRLLRQLTIMTCCLCWAALVHADQPYEISIIETGAVGQQTVLTGFLTNSEVADVVLVTIDAQGQRMLSTFQQHDGQYGSPVVERLLNRDVVVMDVGHYQGRDTIVGFTRSHAISIDPHTGKETELARISSLYSSPIRDAVPQLDLFTDLNGDGLDDLIVPNFDGFLIHTQRADGSFADAVKADAPPIVEFSFNDYPWYQPRQKFLGDMTLDGRDDVAIWVNDQLRVFGQLADGRFQQQHILIDTGIPVDYGGMDELSAAMRDQDQSDSHTRALVDLADLDGDQLTDLMAISVHSSGVFRKRTTYEIYRGVNLDGQLGFTRKPITRIESRGYQFEAVGKDFNNDGQTDMVISAVDVGIGKILAALVTGSVKIDLNFYLMERGEYSAKPDLRREITATFDLRSGDFFFPSVLIVDCDGDGVEDLLVQQGEEGFNIYRGLGNDRLFSKSSDNIKVHMPSDPELVSIADLNRDGKSDFLMRHESSSGPRKVVILVSQ